MSLFFDSNFAEHAASPQPREKLHQHGAKALQLWELVALILRTGERRGGVTESVDQLSKRLIAEAGFKGLFQQDSVAGVQHNLGLYKSHAESLVAVAEICRRLQGNFEQFDASTPDQIAERFAFLKTAKQEQCFVLHLNDQKQCTFQELVAMGQQDTVTVYPSDVLRTALWLGVKNMVIVHNHPQAPSKASNADIQWTLQFAKRTWDLHHITLEDHIIIGNDKAFSFAEQGLL